MVAAISRGVRATCILLKYNLKAVRGRPRPASSGMDPNISQILRQILEKTEENNKILHKLHRTIMWGRVFRILYWVLIIAGAVGVYYYLSPYLQSLFDTYQSLVTGVDQINQTASQAPDFSALLKKFGIQ